MSTYLVNLSYLSISPENTLIVKWEKKVFLSRILSDEENQIQSTPNPDSTE